MKEYEKTYQEKWKEIIENKDGSLNKEQIMKELFDYSIMLENVPIVYKEVTGGLLSKPHHSANSIICEFENYIERLIGRDLEDIVFSNMDEVIKILKGKQST